MKDQGFRWAKIVLVVDWLRQTKRRRERQTWWHHECQDTWEWESLQSGWSSGSQGPCTQACTSPRTRPCRSENICQQKFFRPGRLFDTPRSCRQRPALTVSARLPHSSTRMNTAVAAKRVNFIWSLAQNSWMKFQHFLWSRKTVFTLVWTWTYKWRAFQFNSKIFDSCPK